MILMIDNYDSFTYNLVQYLGELGAQVRVVRNDVIDGEGIARLKPEKIIISPGPGGPEDAGVSCEAIRRFAGAVPLLGVCLGHQCIGAVFGGKVVGAKHLMHGKTSAIFHNGRSLFAGLSNPFAATRYHSLLVERASFPSCLEIIAWTRQREIMGLKHRRLPVWGVQFHPESILTVEGKKLLANFIRL
jgi:anthranilate synthase/aminodeoxychorismate synthase-like glutamine amidotransferase